MSGGVMDRRMRNIGMVVCVVLLIGGGFAIYAGYGSATTGHGFGWLVLAVGIVLVAIALMLAMLLYALSD